MFINNYIIMDKNFSIIFVGDIMLDRKVKQIMKNKHDINWPFNKISQFLNTADIALANMESPILKTGKVTKKIIKCNQSHRGCCGYHCVFKTDAIMVIPLLEA